MNEQKSWCREAWELSVPIYNSIVEQSFNREMMSGELSAERFRRYLEQDMIYIASYAEQMQQLSHMLPSSELQQLFEEFAIEGMEAEKALHATLNDRLTTATEVAPSSITKAYIEHTRQYIEQQNLELSMAAVLPCIWVYNCVGCYIKEHSNLEGNPYREWIETYSSDVMTSGTQLCCELCDKLAADADPETREAMLRVFCEAVWYEWAFWEWAYFADDRSIFEATFDTSLASQILTY